jgi:four helix bundle protein
MQRFTNLKVWQRSHALALTVYRFTNTFPREERFGMTLQVRRAIVSVTSNIAEGAKRKSNIDYARFLNLAEGSLAETESLLLLAKDLKFGDPKAVVMMVDECDEICRMVHALRLSVEAQSSTLT